MTAKSNILQQPRLLLALVALVFLVSLLYGFQILGLQNKVVELRQKTARLADADLEIVNRQVHLQQLNQQIEGLQSEKNEIGSHPELLRYIDAECDKLDLNMVELPVSNIETNDGYAVANIHFSVEGMFHDLLQLIYLLEYRDRIGSIQRTVLERKMIRLVGRQQEMLIAHIHLNRLLKQDRP